MNKELHSELSNLSYVKFFFRKELSRQALNQLISFCQHSSTLPHYSTDFLTFLEIYLASVDLLDCEHISKFITYAAFYRNDPCALLIKARKEGSFFNFYNNLNSYFEKIQNLEQVLQNFSTSKGYEHTVKIEFISVLNKVVDRDYLKFLIVIDNDLYRARAQQYLTKSGTHNAHTVLLDLSEMLSLATKALRALEGETKFVLKELKNRVGEIDLNSIEPQNFKLFLIKLVEEVIKEHKMQKRSARGLLKNICNMTGASLTKKSFLKMLSNID